MNVIGSHFSSAPGSQRIYFKFTLRRPPCLIYDWGVEGTVSTMQSCNLFILSTCDLEFFEYFSPLVETVILSYLSPTSFLMKTW